MNKKNLQKKGWTKKEINEAERITEERKLHDKSRSLVYFNKAVFWAVILVVVVCNFIISFLLVPLLLVLNQQTMDILAVIIGLGFGALFNVLAIDIEHVEIKHHLLAALIVPGLALLNIVFMTRMANSLNNVLQITAQRPDPITISVLYVAAFLAPYLWSALVRKRYSKS